MKRNIIATALLAFSVSAFAIDYPVLTSTSPEKVGFDIKNLTDWIAGFRIKLMPGTLHEYTGNKR